MPRTDDSWNDPDAPQASDVGEDQEDDALPEMACPECGARVTEDTQKCPRCGDWITPVERGGGSWKKWWFAVAVLLMLLAMLRLVF
jgi:hypothetical protein